MSAKNLNYPPVTMAIGETVRLRGTVRTYTGVVTEAGPGTFCVRIGDSWYNRYEWKNGDWAPVPLNKNREAPKTRVIGLIGKQPE